MKKKHYSLWWLCALAILCVPILVAYGPIGVLMAITTATALVAAAFATAVVAVAIIWIIVFLGVAIIKSPKEAWDCMNPMSFWDRNK